MPKDFIKPELILMGKLYVWGPTLSFKTGLEGEQYFCTAYIKHIQDRKFNLVVVKAVRIYGDSQHDWYLGRVEGRRLYKPGTPLWKCYERLKDKVLGIMEEENKVEVEGFEKRLRQVIDKQLSGPSGI